jgi:hypothetical protein
MGCFVLVVLSLFVPLLYSYLPLSSTSLSLSFSSRQQYTCVAVCPWVGSLSVAGH